jgi:hypothetical protein
MIVGSPGCGSSAARQRKLLGGLAGPAREARYNHPCGSRGAQMRSRDALPSIPNKLRDAAGEFAEMGTWPVDSAAR